MAIKKICSIEKWRSYWFNLKVTGPDSEEALQMLNRNFRESVQISENEPVKDSYDLETLRENHNFDYGSLESKKCWFYKGYAYLPTNKHANQDLYSDEQISLLIFQLYDKERKKFERLKNLYDKTEDEVQRKRIPENVRIKVWRRDNGRCVRCGSREKLEYDHIIPISKGGSNTVRNIELLCEKCNRSKGDKIE